MAIITTQEPEARKAIVMGRECPHCQQRDNVYYSRMQRKQPFSKRLVFAYLRCHCCMTLFRGVRVGPLIIWTKALS